MRKTAVALLIVSAIAIPYMAWADTTTIHDANDDPGFLDLRTATATHGAAGRLKHSITTYERWRARALECAKFEIVFPDTDRRLSIVRKSKRLVARMTEGDKTVGHGHVWREAGRKSITVSFDEELLGITGDSYRWHVTALSPPDHCPSGSDYAVFEDRTPEKHNAVHHL
jgi:hypothetical protein